MMYLIQSLGANCVMAPARSMYWYLGSGKVNSGTVSNFIYGSELDTELSFRYNCGPGFGIDSLLLIMYFSPSILRCDNEIGSGLGKFSNFLSFQSVYRWDTGKGSGNGSRLSVVELIIFSAISLSSKVPVWKIY